jgi:nitrile hydratase subunit beta
MPMSFRFAEGDRVLVKPQYPLGHVRTPAYLRGKTGVVTARHGRYRNPEQLAYGRDGEPRVALYEVTFQMGELFSGAPARDTVTADIFEHWLEPA